MAVRRSKARARCAGTALAHLVRNEREAQGPRLDAMASSGAPDGGGPDGRRRLAVAPIPASADRPSLAADRRPGRRAQEALIRSQHEGTVRAHRACGSRSLRAGGPARAGGGGSADGAVPAAGRWCPRTTWCRGATASTSRRPSVSFEDGFALVRLEGRASLVGREQDVFADVTVYGDLDVERTQQQADVLQARIRLLAVDARRVAVVVESPPGEAARRGAGPGSGLRSSRSWLRRSRSRCGELRAGGSGGRARRPGADRRRRDPRSTDRARCDRVRRPALGLDGRGGGPGRGRAPRLRGCRSLLPRRSRRRAWRRCIASSTSGGSAAPARSRDGAGHAHRGRRGDRGTRPSSRRPWSGRWRAATSIASRSTCTTSTSSSRATSGSRRRWARCASGRGRWTCASTACGACSARASPTSASTRATACSSRSPCTWRRGRAAPRWTSRTTARASRTWSARTSRRSRPCRAA